MFLFIAAVFKVWLGCFLALLSVVSLKKILE